MRKLKLVLGICLVAIFLVACNTIGTNVVKVNMPETTYSEGYLNITEIMKTWDMSPMTSSIGGMPMFGFTNPNLDEDIQYVLVLVYMSRPVGYSYLLRGEPYCYFINRTGEFETLPNADKEQWKLNFQQFFSMKGS